MNSTASVTINNSTEMRDAIAFRSPRQSTFRLESEIRHASNNRRDSQFRNSFEFRRSYGVASWHSACSGKERGRSSSKRTSFQGELVMKDEQRMKPIPSNGAQPVRLNPGELVEALSSREATETLS